MRSNPKLYFAGQMTGVEGYIESTASGYVAGINAARQLKGQEPLIFPWNTAIGALAHYISNPAVTKFQPMNVNFGIIEPLNARIRDKKEKYRRISQRALEAIDEMITQRII
jgi:methylenetetrahydrofolate--tRNA-(uracil-5-)-methyltransferase